MGKTEYRTKRRRARDKNPSREERGLSHHPDGTGTHVCPDCEGAGELVVNDTNPHGYGPDPQCDDFVDCDRCLGKGEIEDGVREPLVAMRAARQRKRLHLRGAAFLYGALRRKVATKSLTGLAYAESVVALKLANNRYWQDVNLSFARALLGVRAAA